MVVEKKPTNLLFHFSQLTEPRVVGRCKHRLLDLVAMAICAVIAKCDSWDEVAAWAEAKQEWLKKFLELPHGVPSPDTFERLFRVLEPAEFVRGFQGWVAALTETTGLKHIALDGKWVRGSHERAKGREMLKVVSAWATEYGISLGQVAVSEGSNEIEAIPRLLEILDVSGALVTIDAAGCQKNIAQQIVKQGGDFLLAVKGNQPTLAAAVTEKFAEGRAENFRGQQYETHTETSKGHGREEVRTCEVLHSVVGLPDAELWPTLLTIALVCRVCRMGNKVTTEVRYFISNAKLSAETVQQRVRGHWGIENSLHWVLDVVFREDEHRTRKGNGAENLCFLRKIAISLLKQDKTKGTLKGKRLKAGWDDEYLMNILLGNYSDI